MLRNSETKRYLKTSQIFYVTLFLLCIYVHLGVSSSISNAYDGKTATMLTSNDSNKTIGDDLYVIKAVVYEIGILTDADNKTNNATERQEEVKLSFYSPPTNSDGP